LLTLPPTAPAPPCTAATEAVEVNGRTIVVEEDGTIIISQPAGSTKPVDVKESAEVEYLTGECPS